MDVPENVRKDLIKLLPESLINSTICCCFYDNHPRDPRCLDITVCTDMGEVLEIYQREVVSSLLIQNIKKIVEIIPVRNERCELFYIVAADNQLIILTTKDQMHIHRRITNVDTYEMVDEQCTGKPYLKVICMDDGVPLIFDDNLNLTEKIMQSKSMNASKTNPVMTMLARKLTEARFSVKTNENALNEFIKLKQTAAHALYEKERPNVQDAMFKVDIVQIKKALKIKTPNPSVRVCNKKIILTTDIENDNDVSIDNVHILLHGKSKDSVTYTTKIFKEIPESPYWQEKNSHSLRSNEKCSVVAVVDLKELKYTITSKLEVEGAISYTILDNKHILPLENISISTVETMGEQFDALVSDAENKEKLLAVLATSEKTDLCLRHLKQKGDPHINLSQVFCDQLHMEVFGGIENVIIHRKSPFHMLYGLVIVFNKTEELLGNNHTYSIRLYSSYLSPQDCAARLLNAFGRETPRLSTVRRWFAEFERGRVSLHDEFREGRPSTAVNKNNVATVKRLLN
ncbi:uncharacterized protein LOC126971936 isoform X2 [Leptidea sinapis]|uniref:uncharacterized protein LOC126971936 isoform X2 n=1 Tax=Leptidea sinapis TaxID=189913 RepID=UPI00212D7579|nr:uncharacterized protein LOC126971936 isoform X2 [Leptidea sinapis]